MNKEKILEKIKEEKDEGIKHFKRVGLDLGYRVYILISFIILIFNMYLKKNTNDILSLLMAFIATDGYSRYKFSKNKRHLITITVASIACISYLTLYIIKSLGLL